MAFILKELSVLASANGFTLWHYRSESDYYDAVLKNGYFNGAQHMLRKGDLIIADVRLGKERDIRFYIITEEVNNVTTSLIWR